MAEKLMTIIEEICTLNPWFASLDPEIQKELCEDISIRPLSKDEFLYRQGQAITHIAIVRSGSLWAERSSSEGRNHVMAVMGPGFLGHVEWLVADTRSRYDVRASSISEVFILPLDGIRACLARSPELQRGVLELLARSHALLEEFQFVMAVYGNLEKVAWFLSIAVSGYCGLCKPNRVVPVSQMIIAENMAMSRQTINRMIRELSDAKTIVARREHIEVLDPAALDGICSFRQEMFLRDFPEHRDLPRDGG
ncbi:Crp/Fnr family transcriptional regulator [Swaminathania salitolerans]|uniref:Cyclic nucleotide-binding domain-containing protein n=1 Tax=Swaminathania salitolerans TaxID=182838 RepID=A0A511BNG8_9PROT|nr:Crp/Fnr family transcriptional regulator [Swaminathania salitolerans]GEL01795.1 hypothetical protein SSA02_09580 [Swaminathania salitolerans]